jgi:hypothetical protein
MTWLLARLRCWRRGHDSLPLTADGRYSGCLRCGGLLTNKPAKRLLIRMEAAEAVRRLEEQRAKEMADG